MEADNDGHLEECQPKNKHKRQRRNAADWHIMCQMFDKESGISQGTNISPKNGILKMIFLFPRWDSDMLIPWREVPSDFCFGFCPALR